VNSKEFNEQTGEIVEYSNDVKLDHGISNDTVILNTLKHWSIRDIRE